MRKLIMFNSISLDGYYTDSDNSMAWAYNSVQDKDWDKFVANNASGNGILVFGRTTYNMMESYWPTETAAKQNPEVAAGMNKMRKIVFSRTMKKASWNNTKIISGDLCDEIRSMKENSDTDLVILGSGSLVSQLTEQRLIDEYQLVLIPIVIGKGRTLFDGLQNKISLKLKSSRSFANGNVFAEYVLA